MGACGSSGREEVGDVAGGEVVAESESEAASWDTGGEGDPSGPTCELFFLVAGQDQTLYYDVFRIEDVLVQVLALVENAVVPNPAEMVSCVLEPLVEGQGDASIDPLFAYTDEQGVARLKLKTGTQPDVDYVFTCSTEGCPAPSIQLKIHVSDIPKGDLVIDLVTDAPCPLDFNSIKVRLLPNDTPCDPSLATILEQPSLAEYQVGTIQGVENVTFAGLPIHQKYVVMATAKGPSGHLAAWGCRKNLGADLEDSKTVEKLELVLLSLKPRSAWETHPTGRCPGPSNTIGGLKLGSKLTLERACTMLDTDDNLTVDKLIGGAWDGFVGGEGFPVQGSFTGIRAACQ